MRNSIPSLADTVMSLFHALEMRGIRYAVLRNYESFPTLKVTNDSLSHTDIDLAVDSRDLEEFRATLAEVAETNGWDTLAECDHWTQSSIRHHNIENFQLSRAKPLEYLQVDVFHGVLVWGLPIFDEHQMLEGRIYDRDRVLTRMDPVKENIHRMLQCHGLYPGSERKRNRYRAKVLAFRASDRDAFDRGVRAKLPLFGIRALDALERGDTPSFVRNMSYARTWFAISFALRNLLAVPAILVCRLRENIKRYFTRPCGMVIRTAVRDEAQRQVVRDAMDELVKNSFMDDWIEQEAGARRSLKDCVEMEQGALAIQWSDAANAALDLRDVFGRENTINAILDLSTRRHKRLYVRAEEPSRIQEVEATAR